LTETEKEVKATERKLNIILDHVREGNIITAAGKEAVIMARDSWLKERLRNAKAVVKEWYEGKLLWKDLPIYLVNTKEGSHAYHRETGKLPVINAGAGWDSEYGSLESHNGKHFIFLNSIIVDNYAEGDVLSTIIHEILHVIYPGNLEKETEEMTEAVCEHFNIIPEKILESL